VKLINLDDLVILGPGSEWLWTMVSGIVLAVTFVAIYRQLRLQRDAAAIEQVGAIYREWADERMSRAKLETLLLIRDGADASAILTAALDVGDFWEGYAYLVRAGNINRRLMYDSLGPAARIWWGLLAPSARVAREQANDHACGSTSNGSRGSSPSSTAAPGNRRPTTPPTSRGGCPT
jgi:hypothetical protein